MGRQGQLPINGSGGATLVLPGGELNHVDVSWVTTPALCIRESSLPLHIAVTHVVPKSQSVPMI